MKTSYSGDMAMFSWRVASVFGITGALIINKVEFWCSYVENDRRPAHYKDGRYWIYKSQKQWSTELGGMWSEDVIQREIAKLKKAGVLLARQDMNDSPFARLTWYAVDTDRLESILNQQLPPNTPVDDGDDPDKNEELEQMHQSAKMRNGDRKNTGSQSAPVRNIKRDSIERQQPMPETAHAVAVAHSSALPRSSADEDRARFEKLAAQRKKGLTARTEDRESAGTVVLSHDSLPEFYKLLYSVLGRPSIKITEKQRDALETEFSIRDGRKFESVVSLSESFPTHFWTWAKRIPAMLERQGRRMVMGEIVKVLTNPDYSGHFFSYLNSQGVGDPTPTYSPETKIEVARVQEMYDFDPRAIFETPQIEDDDDYLPGETHQQYVMRKLQEAAKEKAEREVKRVGSIFEDLD